MCLINHSFPAIADDEKVVTLQRLLPTQKKKSEVKEETALKALRMLESEEDGKMFSTLRDRLEDTGRDKAVFERFGSAKEKKQFATPDCLKQLRPDVTTSNNTSGFGAVLTWQVSTHNFQGYYPVELDPDDVGTRRKRFTSTSRKYNSDTLDDMVKALQQVVNFLWREHIHQGGSDIDKPTKDEVCAAMAQAEQELKEGKCTLYNVDDVDVQYLANLKAESVVEKPGPKAPPPKPEKKHTAKKPGSLTLASAPPLKALKTDKKEKADKADKADKKKDKKSKKRKVVSDSESSRPESPIDFDKIKKDLKFRKKKN